MATNCLLIEFITHLSRFGTCNVFLWTALFAKLFYYQYSLLICIRYKVHALVESTNFHESVRWPFLLAYVNTLSVHYLHLFFYLSHFLFCKNESFPELIVILVLSQMTQRLWIVCITIKREATASDLLWTFLRLIQNGGFAHLLFRSGYTTAHDTTFSREVARSLGVFVCGTRQCQFLADYFNTIEFPMMTYY